MCAISTYYIHAIAISFLGFFFTPAHSPPPFPPPIIPDTLPLLNDCYDSILISPTPFPKVPN